MNKPAWILIAGHGGEEGHMSRALGGEISIWSSAAPALGRDLEGKEDQG